LSPPLEHAPDQMASRPLEMLSVIDMPAANDADPELPTLTLMPAGLGVTGSPLRPRGRDRQHGGALRGRFTVSAAVRVTPGARL
jgi:hypothetical protein